MVILQYVWALIKLFTVLFSTQRPPGDCPDALDHLAIGLVANRYTKLKKTSENLSGVVL